MWHIEIFASTAEHTAALHERFAKPVPAGTNEAVVDVETVAYGPKAVARGRKLVIQRDSDAIPEDGHGWHQRRQLAPSDPGKLHSAIERIASGSAVMDADTLLSDSSVGAGKGAKGDHKRCAQRDDALQTSRRSRRQVQVLTQRIRYEVQRQRQESKQRDILMHKVRSGMETWPVWVLSGPADVLPFKFWL